MLGSGSIVLALFASPIGGLVHVEEATSSRVQCFSFTTNQFQSAYQPQKSSAEQLYVRPNSETAGALGDAASLACRVPALLVRSWRGPAFCVSVSRELLV